MNSLKLSFLYQQACEIELQAFKPGNVSVYSEGHGMTVNDFRLSAKVSTNPLCHFNHSLGEKIFYAVQATRYAVGCNTNLGIILLCAPLIESRQRYSECNLREGLKKVLQNTTVEDANWVFKAITLASPAGLGNASIADVNKKATVNLLDAMRLAQTRDFIGFQYASDYKDIFDFSVLSYNDSFNRWNDQNWAAVKVYVDLLSRFPDSHIERKFGSQHSKLIKEKMTYLSGVLSATSDPCEVLPMLYDVDSELKALGLNPGTTADLTVATVLTVFLENTLQNAKISLET